MLSRPILISVFPHDCEGRESMAHQRRATELGKV
jgi:hypothetical protein